MPIKRPAYDKTSFWKADCFFCGDKIAVFSPNRINSSLGLGYTIENCVPCCTMCNLIRHDRDIDVLNMHLLKMLKHQRII